MQWVHDLAARMDQSAFARFTGKANPKYVAVDAPLSREVIERHLSKSNAEPIAAYVLSHREENKGQVIVFDFDDHAGTCKNMEQLVATFCAMLSKKKISYTVVQSGGGKGYHVWLVFDSPKRKDLLRDGAKKLLTAFEFEGRTFTEGTGGADQGQIEIFPKGDGTGGKNAIALPLARKSVLVRLKDSNGVLSLPHYGNEHQLPLIKKAAPGPKAKTAKTPDPDAAFAALISTRDPANYEDWVHVAMRLIAAFGLDDEWAKAKWIEWSQTATGADSEHEQEKKWQQCRDSRLSPATFWLEARDNGYSGDLPFSKTDLDRHQVLDFAAKFPIYRSQDNETFARIGPRHFVPIKSRLFEACIVREASSAGRLLKAEDLSAVTRTLDAHALIEPKTEFALRFAHHGDKRFLFSGDETCTVIEIDASGWRVCDDPPVCFLGGDGRALPMPVSGGTVDELRRFVNADDENLPVLLAWMVACIVRPGKASPIAILTGPAGSAKSSVLQLAVDLLDPKAGSRGGMPTKEDDLVVAAHQGALVSFDNATTLNRLSDELCRLATGGGLRKRTLFTDKDVTAIDVIRPVIIAGIDPVAHQQDLIERLLIIELRPPLERIDDETLVDMISEARPRLLGFLLDLVVKVLAMPAPSNVEGVRMVGFAGVGERVAVALGREPGWFTEWYRAMLAESAEEGADGDCVFQLILMLLANGDGSPLRLTSSQVLDALHQHILGKEITVSPADVPNNPRAMTSRINRVAEPLRRFKGVQIGKREREWIFSSAPVATDEQVFASIQPPF